MATTTLPDETRLDHTSERIDGNEPPPMSAQPATRGALTVSAAVASAGSAAAGLVHVAAAGSHNADRGLAWAFAIAAVLQIGAAGAHAAHRRRGILASIVALNAAALVAWGYTRARGTTLLSGLEEAQDIALADGSAAAFETIAVVAGVLGLFRVVSTALRPAWATALVAAALLGALPSMAVPHEHTGDGTTLASGDHGHGARDDAKADAKDAKADPNVVLGVRLPQVDGVTPAQKLAAAKLINDTKAGMARFPTVDAVIAAGYRSIGDGFTGFEHFVHAGYLVNPNVLDAAEPESLVYKVLPDGTRELASAMYIMPVGKTMADVPDVAGAMSPWHDHQNLCWDASGIKLAGILRDGKCVPGGTFRPTPPMLHVWVTEHPCGPFAGIEGTDHVGACHAH